VQKKLTYISIIFLIIIYLVGVIGVSGKNRNEILELTPLNLLVTFIILAINKPEPRSRDLLFPFIAIVTGIIAEITGVHTGLLFGQYHYGTVLGPSVWGVPVIIGLNWAMLIYTASDIINKYKLNLLIKAGLSAFMVTMLDVLIEPIAVKLGFWHWHSLNIPFSNYVTWFAISFFLSILFYKIRPEGKRNPLSEAVFAIQLLFFAVLNIIL
jgi:putative membrane protein